jgi:hypothetical protein
LSILARFARSLLPLLHIHIGALHLLHCNQPQYQHPHQHQTTDPTLPA